MKLRKAQIVKARLNKIRWAEERMKTAPKKWLLDTSRPLYGTAPNVHFPLDIQFRHAVNNRNSDWLCQAEGL